MASEVLGSAVILSTSLAAFSSDEGDVYVMMTFPGLQKSYQQESCYTDLRSSPSQIHRHFSTQPSRRARHYGDFRLESLRGQRLVTSHDCVKFLDV